MGTNPELYKRALKRDKSRTVFNVWTPENDRTDGVRDNAEDGDNAMILRL